MGITGLLTSGVMNLIFPKSCVICGAPDIELCAECIAQISPDWQRVDGDSAYLQVFAQTVQNAGKNEYDFVSQMNGNKYGEFESSVTRKSIFPVYSPNRYTGVVKELIIAWKHSNLIAFDNLVLQIWRTELYALSELLSLSGENLITLFPRLDPERKLYVVNAPSKFRRRFDNQLVAWKLAQELSACIRAQPLEALRKKYESVSFRYLLAKKMTVYLKARQCETADLNLRRRKSQGMKAVKNLAGKQVLLVDDVLTTGATLLGSARAVEAVGGEVIGAVCFANTVKNARSC